MTQDDFFLALERMGDKEQADKMSAYMQNQFPFLGIPKPELKLFMKPYLKETKKLALDWEFVKTCWEKPYREAQYIAIEYLEIHKKELKEEDLDTLKDLVVSKSWWETVDSLDAYIGIIVEENPKLESVMLEWSISDNIWLRRVAIDFQQEYKEKTNADLLSKIVCNNLGRNEFFVNKAIGWSLRDYSKTNPEWVRDFIEKKGSQMATLSIKEASKYL